MNILHERKQKSVKIFRWIGWGMVYLLAFYLGNLAGEYTAARMPIGSFSLSSKFNISLPRITIVWNGWKSPWGNREATISAPPTTKSVVVAGRFFTVPQEGATTHEQEAFVDSVKEVAVAAVQLEVSQICEITPAFSSLTADVPIRLVNRSSQARSVRLESKAEPVSVAAGETVTVGLGSIPLGAYGIFCDEIPAGFYVASSK